MEEEQGGSLGEVLASVAQPVADIFGGITDLITTSPRRIGRSIVRENQVNLHTNTNDLMNFLAMQSQSIGGDSIKREKKVDYSTTLLTIAVFAMILILILKTKK